MTEQTIDREKVGAAAGRLVEAINSGSLVLLCSIGHQTGLFDTMATLPASTSGQIASAAELNERYVREWLAGMVTSRVIEYDPATQTYTLPPDFAACLTTAAGPNNLAVVMQFLPMLAQVEGPIVECVRNGGGLTYGHYRRFHAVMAESSAAVNNTALIHSIVPLVEGLPERLQAGIDVLDVGCGRGHAINLLASAFPNSRFTGFDFSEEAIAVACEEAAAWGLTNATFELRDVSVLALRERFDLITAFDAIHDQAHPAQVLAGIVQALRPGGTFLMVDVRASSRLEDNIGHPMGASMYATSLFHCMSVSLGLGGAGLGTMWGEQLAHQMLTDAGFRTIEVRSVEGDILNSYYIATKN